MGSVMWQGDIIDSFDEVSPEENESEDFRAGYRWTSVTKKNACRFAKNCSALDWMERYGARISEDSNVCDDCPFCNPMNRLGELEDRIYGN